jgi:hypothetical protein
MISIKNISRDEMVCFKENESYSRNDSQKTLNNKCHPVFVHDRPYFISQAPFPLLIVTELGKGLPPKEKYVNDKESIPTFPFPVFVGSRNKPFQKLKIVPNSLLVAKRFIELLIRMRKAVGRKG